MGFHEVHRLVLAVMVTAMMGTASVTALAEAPRPIRAKPGQRDITILNSSHRPIYQLRVSPSEADQWGDDRLGETATIPPGGSLRVPLGRTSDCQFDVQVIYDNVGQEERRAIDVCRTRIVGFDGSTAKMPPDPFAAARAITLTNRAGRAIRQVFISSPSADQWGDDLAPSRGIAPGQSGPITFRGGCTADMRVVFDNRSAEERRNIDFCADTAVLIRPGWTTEDAAAPAPALAPDEVTVLNLTGKSVTELYLRPESAKAEDDADLLGNAVLPVGGRLTLPFARGTACRFIARIIHGGDIDPSEQPGIDLCRDPTITLAPPKAAG